MCIRDSPNLVCANNIHASPVIGYLLGWRPGRPGPGGKPSACRWKGIRPGLLGGHQARHCLAVPALNRGRPWAWAAREDVGVLGPVCEARTSTRCLRAVSYTHLRAHETVLDIVCRLLL